MENSFLSASTIDHVHITVYADEGEGTLAAKIKETLNDRNYKILTPGTLENLPQAARNSALVIIDLDNVNPENRNVAQSLRSDRLVAADIIGISQNDEDTELSPKLYLKGYDLFFSWDQLSSAEIKKLLAKRLAIGSHHLSQLLIEEEYRRFSDALSSAPASVMVFDQDKRLVFVSEHYFRAYPKSASRLSRGLSVFDAFEMMAKEEDLDTSSDLYQTLKNFWYNLDGKLEFTLDSGISYRLKAVPLPNQRGTILTAINISGYVAQKRRLQEVQAELAQNKA